MTQLIVADYQQQTQNYFSALNVQLNNMTKLINDNQSNLKNLVTQTQTQLSDVKMFIGTNFDEVDISLARLNTELTNHETNDNSRFSNIINTCAKESSMHDQIQILTQRMSSLANQINQLSVNISSSSSGCKTPGSISEGDGLCKCSWYGNPSPSIQSDGKTLDLFTASYQGFIPRLNMCCQQLIYA
ncbi:Hypothetical_protein [Hexamita inflata]